MNVNRIAILAASFLLATNTFAAGGKGKPGEELNAPTAEALARRAELEAKRGGAVAKGSRTRSANVRALDGKLFEGLTPAEKAAVEANPKAQEALEVVRLRGLKYVEDQKTVMSLTGEDLAIQAYLRLAVATSGKTGGWPTEVKTAFEKVLQDATDALAKPGSKATFKDAMEGAISNAQRAGLRNLTLERILEFCLK